MSPAEQDHARIHKVEYPAIASEADLKLLRIPLRFRDLCSKSIPPPPPSPLASQPFPRVPPNLTLNPAWNRHLINYYQCQNVDGKLPWKCHPEK